MFDLVERIRQTSIRFHRDDDKPARRELELILERRVDQPDRADRARLELFLRISDIAEDQRHPPDAARDRASGAPRASMLIQTLAHASPQAISAADLARFFGTAQVSPV